MKLSEAILLGSIGSEQGYGNESMVSGAKRKCALGAALLATGVCVYDSSIGYNKIEELWPWVNAKTISPLDIHKEFKPQYILNIIFRLNDTAKWTRPAIAAWIATIEPQSTIETIEVPHLAKVV